MAGVSSLGVGSGLDLNALVTNLLAAERAPVERSLNRQQARFTSTLSGVGLFKASLSGFQSSLSSFDNVANFNTRNVNNSNSAALNVTTTNSAAAGSYDIDVNALAKRQSLASTGYTNTTDIVGTGEIQIRFGIITGPGFTSFAVNPEKTTQTITVDSSNNTLVGLKDHINNGDFGISASIINDGSGNRLTFTSKESGASNALEINITDTGDASNTDVNGLSNLAYNATASNQTQTQAAIDASISVNGLAITSGTNTLDKVIEGVTLNLNEITTTSISVGISESSAQLKTSIRGIVGSYNDMIGNLNKLSFAGSSAGSAGALFGDASFRSFSSASFRLLTSPVAGLNGSITAMSNIGIKTQADGTLAIDESIFSSTIDANPDDAVALFSPLGQTNDSLIKFNSSTALSNAGNYAVEVTTIATQAQLNGGVVNSLTIDDNNDQFTFAVDGISTGSISLTQGVYASKDAIANEIQSKINSVTSLVSKGKSVNVNYDSGANKFVLTSNTYGNLSNVEILAIDTNSTADLGLQVAGADIAGVDVAGSIGGVAATGVGQKLSVSSGLSIDVLGGTTGSRGSLKFTRGLVEGLNTLLDGYLNSATGTLQSREESLTASLKGIAEERIDLDRKLVSVEARLVKQFTALDQLIAKFQSTGNFITQQIANLPGSGQILNK
jgi:flagellar hook-associated protein 2